MNQSFNKIVERYNKLMATIGYEHSSIETEYSENTEGWGVKEMVAECEYYLSTYYEGGHMNNELIRGGQGEKNEWRSHTGKLKRFIATYKEMEATA